MSIASPWFSLQPYPRWPLPYLLEAAAARYPDRTAFINFDGRSYTFEQMWSGARRIARFLQEKGLTKGDRVGILAPNCPEYVVAFYGTLLAGGVLTTFNPLYREREVQHQLEDAGAVVLFHSTLHGPLVDGIRDGAKTVRHYLNLDEIWTLADSVAGEPARVAIDPEEDLAALPYSSGTTGLPKGVMLTHFNLVSNVRQINGVGMLDRYSVLLDFLPFYHIYGLTVLMNSGLAAGASQVVVPRFDPELILGLVAKYGATHLLVVPPALLVLSSMPDLGRFDTSSLLWIISGAAPLAPEVGFRGQEAFSCTVLQGYGLTETSPFINTNPGHRVKMASVGPPVADTEEKVVDLETGVELGPGQVGEILVRGPQVMKGYWRQPQATAECFTEDGWLRTGDIGSFDEDGYVYVVDRKKEMIKYKGYQVAPAELEAVLLEHASVLDAAVIPKPDAASGEIPKAFVVPAPGAHPTAEAIMDFVAQRVAPYKKIRQVEFVDSIPKTLSGKILRRELIERERAASKK